MADSLAQYSDSISSTRLIQRRWIRHDRPLWPFFWRGLLPLLGLLLLGAYAIWPFARGDVESTVLQQTRAQLASHGHEWTSVAVSGQNVTISGMEPKPGDGAAALAIARAAACPTWAGRLTCAVSVNGQFTTAPTPVAAPAAPPAPEPAAAAPAPQPAVAQACEKSLADLLAKSKIEFATGSAAIKASSAGLLDALATAVRECPGVIRVEGHTDSQGHADNNKNLSMARATAVRAALLARGVAAEQLQAQGFGADEPIADNSSVQGRAQNRRIEFRVVTINRN